MRGERGGGASSRNGYHHNRWSERDSLPPYERFLGGDGPLAREADIRGDQGEWTWVSHRRRKASRPVWNGRDDSRFGYRHDGKYSSRLDNRWDSVSQQGYEARTRHRQVSLGRQHVQELGHASREGFRAWNHKSRGRSLSRSDTTSFDRKNTQQSNVQGEKKTDPKAPGSVVFYISNFPEHLLFVDLKKGLEVCGILEDIYVSRYRNFYGQRFGFVKFMKVKDEHKLRKALNNVHFWEFKLFANIAKYDRFVKEEKEEKEVFSDDGKKEQERATREKKGGMQETVWRKKELIKVKEEAVRSERKRELESGGKMDGVGSQVKEEIIIRKEEVESEGVGKKDEEEDRKGDMQWRYMPLQEDVDWASQSFFARIKNGLQVIAVQQALVDAGLEEIKLIPMGGENVLIRSNGQGQIKEVISSAADLIQNFMEDITPWSKELEVHNTRGAWVRCYGIPIHAWNPIFLAEVADTQGRLLLIDDLTLNKERLDYARILLSTHSKESIHGTLQVLIDDLAICIRIIEEEGTIFAKDACLHTQDNDNFSLCSAHTGYQENEQILEEFVQQLHEDWVEDLMSQKEETNVKEDIFFHQQDPSLVSKNISKPDVAVVNSTKPDAATLNHKISLVSQPSRPAVQEVSKKAVKQVPGVKNNSVSQEVSKSVAKQVPGVKKNAQPLPNVSKPLSKTQRQQKSLTNKQETEKNSSSQESVKRSTKKKIFIPTVFGLKRMARLPEEERKKLIRSLKAVKRQNGGRSSSNGVVKTNQNCTSLTGGSGSSSGSKNSKEWNNWTILHQGDKQVQKDIEEIGETIGVECHNSFEILAGGRGKNRGKGGVSRK